jgi:hypothetical protein
VTASNREQCLVLDLPSLLPVPAQPKKAHIPRTSLLHDPCVCSVPNIKTAFTLQRTIFHFCRLYVLQTPLRVFVPVSRNDSVRFLRVISVPFNRRVHRPSRARAFIECCPCRLCPCCLLLRQSFANFSQATPPIPPHVRIYNVSTDLRARETLP